jgi:hypothetical protein
MAAKSSPLEPVSKIVSPLIALCTSASPTAPRTIGPARN